MVDPRRTETAQLAHVHLQPIPGEDPAVLASMLHVILRERRYDEDFTYEETFAQEPIPPPF